MTLISAALALLLALLFLVSAIWVFLPPPPLIDPEESPSVPQETTASRWHAIRNDSSGRELERVKALAKESVLRRSPAPQGASRFLAEAGLADEGSRRILLIAFPVCALIAGSLTALTAALYGISIPWMIMSGSAGVIAGTFAPALFVRSRARHRTREVHFRLPAMIRGIAAAVGSHRDVGKGIRAFLEVQEARGANDFILQHLIRAERTALKGTHWKKALTQEMRHVGHREVLFLFGALARLAGQGIALSGQLEDLLRTLESRFESLAAQPVSAARNAVRFRGPWYLTFKAGSYPGGAAGLLVGLFLMLTVWFLKLLLPSVILDAAAAGACALPILVPWIFREWLAGKVLDEERDARVIMQQIGARARNGIDAVTALCSNDMLLFLSSDLKDEILVLENLIRGGQEPLTLLLLFGKDSLAPSVPLLVLFLVLTRSTDTEAHWLFNKYSLEPEAQQRLGRAR